MRFCLLLAACFALAFWRSAAVAAPPATAPINGDSCASVYDELIAPMPARTYHF